MKGRKTDKSREGEGDGELGCDAEAPGRFLSAVEAKDGSHPSSKADPSRSQLGLLLRHAPQGFSKLRSRHPTSRAADPQCRPCVFSIWFSEALTPLVCLVVHDTVLFHGRMIQAYLLMSKYQFCCPFIVTSTTVTGISQVETVDDYNEYCHYVAGLVGLGLSKLFHASGLEDMAPDPVSNSMGLFLQKTNIIRDYLKDINEMPKSHMFWPHQVWRKYANKLEDWKYEEYSVKAIFCLNEMVTNALTHVEDCLQYTSALQNPSVFQFCPIPQHCELQIDSWILDFIVSWGWFVSSSITSFVLL